MFNGYVTETVSKTFQKNNVCAVIQCSLMSLYVDFSRDEVGVLGLEFTFRSGGIPFVECGASSVAERVSLSCGVRVSCFYICTHISGLEQPPRRINLLSGTTHQKERPLERTPQEFVKLQRQVRTSLYSIFSPHI